MSIKVVKTFSAVGLLVCLVTGCGGGGGGSMSPIQQPDPSSEPEQNNGNQSTIDNLELFGSVRIRDENNDAASFGEANFYYLQQSGVSLDAFTKYFDNGVRYCIGTDSNEPNETNQMFRTLDRNV